MVRALDLRAKDREFDPPVLLSGYDIGQVVHTHVPLSSSGKNVKGQRAVMPCGSEGNRRSGVALAMCHRLQWFIRLYERKMYTPHCVWHTVALRKGSTYRQTCLSG